MNEGVATGRICSCGHDCAEHYDNYKCIEFCGGANNECDCMGCNCNLCEPRHEETDTEVSR